MAKNLSFPAGDKTNRPDEREQSIDALRLALADGESSGDAGNLDMDEVKAKARHAVVVSRAEFDGHQQFKLELLRRDIEKGLEDVKRGRTASAVSAFAEMDRELDE